MIKNRTFIEIEDFTEEVSKKHNVDLNKAWKILYNIVGVHTMEDVDLMIEDGYAPEAWGWLKDFMTKNSMEILNVDSRDAC